FLASSAMTPKSNRASSSPMMQSLTSTARSPVIAIAVAGTDATYVAGVVPVPALDGRMRCPLQLRAVNDDSSSVSVSTKSESRTQRLPCARVPAGQTELPAVTSDIAAVAVINTIARPITFSLTMATSTRVSDDHRPNGIARQTAREAITDRRRGCAVVGGPDRPTRVLGR